MDWIKNFLKQYKEQIVAVIVIGTFLFLRIYDSNKLFIDDFLYKINNPLNIEIDSCTVENDNVIVKAHYKNKRNLTKKMTDDNLYLLEFEPFERGDEDKRYISFINKNEDLTFEIPLLKENADERRYYGDRKYNKFGIAVWNNDKYILISNLRNIDYYFDNNVITEYDGKDNEVNIFITNPYKDDTSFLIRDDATIRNYYKYYVPNTFERKGYNKTIEAFENIYKVVKRKYNDKFINWHFGITSNYQINNYLSKENLQKYCKEFYYPLNVFFTFFNNKNIENNSNDNICINVIYDEDEKHMTDVNYDAKKFIRELEKNILENGNFKLNIMDNKKIEGEEYKLCDFLNY